MRRPTVHEREHSLWAHVRKELEPLGFLVRGMKKGHRGQRILTLERNGEPAGTLKASLDGRWWAFLCPGAENPRPGYVWRYELIGSMSPREAIRSLMKDPPEVARPWVDANLDLLEAA